MNLDHDQIVAALNNNGILFSLIQQIFPSLMDWQKTSKENQQRVSIWDIPVRNFDI